MPDTKKNRGGRSSTSARIRVVVLDDHEVVRAGVRGMLSAASDLEVVGEASDGASGLDLVRRVACDVVLTDVSMPPPCGAELVAQLRALRPSARILVFSMHGEGFMVSDLLRAGALGYLTKGCGSDTLVSAVRAVAKGGRYVEPRLAEEIFLRFSGEEGFDDIGVLSPRENEVLVWLARGLGVNQIAEELCLSGKTVSAHKASLMRKLRLENESQVIRYAIQHGLVD